MTALRNPIQPIVTDELLQPRFKENAIVRKLLDFSTQNGYGLNEIARDDFSQDDRIQLAQLIGYSLRGFGTLSYVDDHTYYVAQALADGAATEADARKNAQETMKAYDQQSLDDLRRALAGPISQLYGISPQDLIDC